MDRNRRSSSLKQEESLHVSYKSTGSRPCMALYIFIKSYKYILHVQTHIDAVPHIPSVWIFHHAIHRMKGFHQGIANIQRQCVCAVLLQNRRKVQLTKASGFWSSVAVKDGKAL
jgi:hypothetical protein